MKFCVVYMLLLPTAVPQAERRTCGGVDMSLMSRMAMFTVSFRSVTTPLAATTLTIDSPCGSGLISARRRSSAPWFADAF